jgi:hypothetical protein
MRIKFLDRLTLGPICSSLKEELDETVLDCSKTYGFSKGHEIDCELVEYDLKYAIVMYHERRGLPCGGERYVPIKIPLDSFERID